MTDHQEATPKRNRRAIPFHPVLFAIAPILFVFRPQWRERPRSKPRRTAAARGAFPGCHEQYYGLSLGLLFRSATRAAPGRIALYRALLLVRPRRRCPGNPGAMNVRRTCCPAVLGVADGRVGTWLAIRFQSPRLAVRSSESRSPLNFHRGRGSWPSTWVTGSAGIHPSSAAHRRRPHGPAAAAGAAELPRHLLHHHRCLHSDPTCSRRTFTPTTVSFLGELSTPGMVLIIDRAQLELRPDLSPRWPPRSISPTWTAWPRPIGAGVPMTAALCYE